VLREIRATLGRLPVAAERKARILDRLEDPRETDRVDPVPDSGFRCADPSDDKFLHLTIAAGAEALITSDRALLEVEGFPVPIVKSGQWLREVDRRSK
jgi:predicted nucleic acid-binding protein